MNGPNPTLLIGLGAFGRAVLARAWPGTPASPDDPLADLLPDAARSAGPTGPVEVICADAAGADTAEATAADIADRARTASARLLDLGFFVATTAPRDARGPQLDVFVIADLSEPGVAALAPAAIRAITAALREAFRPIFGTGFGAGAASAEASRPGQAAGMGGVGGGVGDGALAVCSLVVAPRAADDAVRASYSTAIRELAALARGPATTRPRGRVYVVEDQSGKYLLARGELERSLAALLHLLLYSALRDDPAGRLLVEDLGDDRSPLGTFACATLEIDTAALRELCAARLARELLAEFRPGALPLSELAAEAQPLIPERTEVMAALWSEGPQATDLEQYLEPPGASEIGVPTIAWTDSPEQISDKFGAGWQAEVEHRLDQFRDDIEQLKMDRLAHRIEESGTALATRVEAALIERLVRELSATARGPMRALEIARYAGARATARADRARAALAAPALRAFPPSPLNDGVAQVASAARAWPRRDPPRMPVLGGITAALVMFACAGAVHLALSLLGVRLPWWAAGAIGAAFAASSVGYALWRHRKRHFNWLVHARDALDQALVRHTRDDIVDYFRRRLDYTAALWEFRVYRELADRLAELVAQLEAARAALADADRRLAAIESAAENQAGAAGAAGAGSADAHAGRNGVLYRTALHAHVVRAFYSTVRPPDMAAAARRYLTWALAADRGGVREADSADDTARAAARLAALLEAPYADPERAMAFARRELSHVAELSPFEPADSPLHAAARECVREYLGQLVLALSPPLEVMETRAGDAPAPRRVLCAPPEAFPLIRELFADTVGTLRLVASPGDARRMHLLVERGELPVEAVAIAAHAVVRPAVASGPAAPSGTAEDAP